MANLVETEEYPAGIYQLETVDPVLGGPPSEATGAGMDNIPHQQLAKRTRWLKARVDQLVAMTVGASTAAAGLVQLSSATNSTSEVLAATPKAVKTAFDLANGAARKTTSIATDGLATGGGTLAADRTITVSDATQAEAEAGTISTKAMSPLRVAQAIIKRLTDRTISAGDGLTGGGTLAANRSFAVDASVARTTRTIATAGLATGGGSLAADRTITVSAATKAEAEAGTINTTAMTPLRVMEAITSRIDMGAVLSASGYQRLPSGLLLQWGTSPNTDEDGYATVTFPVAFAVKPYAILTGERTADASAVSAITSVAVLSTDMTATQVSLRMRNYSGLPAAGDTAFWLAIGR